MKQSFVFLLTWVISLISFKALETDIYSSHQPLFHLLMSFISIASIMSPQSVIFSFFFFPPENQCFLLSKWLYYIARRTPVNYEKGKERLYLTLIEPSYYLLPFTIFFFLAFVVAITSFSRTYLEKNSGCIFSHLVQSFEDIFHFYFSFQSFSLIYQFFLCYPYA